MTALEMYHRKKEQISAFHQKRLADIEAGKLNHLGNKFEIIHFLRKQSEEIIKAPRNYTSPATEEDLREWELNP